MKEVNKQDKIVKTVPLFARYFLILQPTFE